MESLVMNFLMDRKAMKGHPELMSSKESCSRLHYIYTGQFPNNNNYSLFLTKTVWFYTLS